MAEKDDPVFFRTDLAPHVSTFIPAGAKQALTSLQFRVSPHVLLPTVKDAVLSIDGNTFTSAELVCNGVVTPLDVSSCGSMVYIQCPFDTVILLMSVSIAVRFKRPLSFVDVLPLEIKGTICSKNTNPPPVFTIPTKMEDIVIVQPTMQPSVGFGVKSIDGLMDAVQSGANKHTDNIQEAVLEMQKKKHTTFTTDVTQPLALNVMSIAMNATDTFKSEVALKVPLHALYDLRLCVEPTTDWGHDVVIESVTLALGTRFIAQFVAAEDGCNWSCETFTRDMPLFLIKTNVAPTIVFRFKGGISGLWEPNVRISFSGYLFTDVVFKKIKALRFAGQEFPLPSAISAATDEGGSRMYLISVGGVTMWVRSPMDLSVM